jgi:hypothetical protein
MAGCSARQVSAWGVESGLVVHAQNNRGEYKVLLEVPHFGTGPMHDLLTVSHWMSESHIYVQDIDPIQLKPGEDQ